MAADDVTLGLDSDEEEEQIDPATLVADLYAACKAGEAGEAEELQEIRVPPFFTEGDTGWTCLHWAARHGLVAVVEGLLEQDAAQP